MSAHRVEFRPTTDPVLSYCCTGTLEGDRYVCPGERAAILIDGEHYGDVCCPNEEHIARAVQEAIADHEAWRSGTSIFAPYPPAGVEYPEEQK